jgi:hypothetical protein
VSHDHWKTTTFTGALRLSRLTAPMVLDGAMTGEWFTAYARQVLAPTPAPWRHCHPRQPACPPERRRPGSHPSRRGDTALPAAVLAGLQPDRERLFQAQGALRKAATRTIDALLHAIRDALPQFLPQECASYFTAAGYEPD